MDYTQFESTPLGGIDLPGFVKADDIVNIAVNYANNRTEDYFVVMSLQETG